MLERMKRIFSRKSREMVELEYRVAKGMHIGNNCHIYSSDTIDGIWPWLISIGDNVTISTNVTILAHDASPNIVRCGTKRGKVEIGNNVIVGAGSVVSQDLPSDGVYAGVPARRLCSIEEYREKYVKLREECSDLSEIRGCNEWDDATEQEKEQMRSCLRDGIGFI